MSDLIKRFTKTEFNTEEPYRLLYELRDDGWRYMQTLNALADNAKEVGFTNFKAMVKAYFKNNSENVGSSGIVNNTTNFKEQPIELYTGDWLADDMGIMKRNSKQGMDVACTHPILPVLRLVNVEDETVKLKIAFRRDGKPWRTFVANKSQLYSARELKKLTDKDISVSDKNASFLVEYLQEIEDLNYDIIEEKKSVSHLGWTRDGAFSPYMKDIEFDGFNNYDKIFRSVKPTGDFDKWLDVAKTVRKQGIVARIALAASFASLLVKAIGKLNFIVHFWGKSGTGKTVALRLASSVWADPKDGGRYMQTFNGTAVGLELLAGFFNNLPLILDEFQLVKDKKSFEYSVYLLTEGIGKTRGAKSGGLQDTPTWSNCAITSGEMPITHESIGGGAANRIIEIECKNKVFTDPENVLEVLNNNYGHAGRIFVELLSGHAAQEEAKQIYKKFYQEIGPEITEKQAMSAALLLTADALATKWIFCDNYALKTSDLQEFLKNKESVDIGRRGYEYVYGYCVENHGKFDPGSDTCYGKMDEEELIIIGTAFNRICNDGGFNPDAVIGWMDEHGRLKRGNDGKTRQVKKINRKSIRCVCIDIRSEDERVTHGFMSIGDEKLPFS